MSERERERKTSTIMDGRSAKCAALRRISPLSDRSPILLLVQTERTARATAAAAAAVCLFYAPFILSLFLFISPLASGAFVPYLSSFSPSSFVFAFVCECECEGGCEMRCPRAT